MKNVIKLFLSFVLICACFTAYAKVYKWVDAEGNVVYSDVPPPEAAAVTEVKTSGTEKNMDAQAVETGQEPKNENKQSVTSANDELGEICRKAITESLDTLETYVQTARKNLQGGHITQLEYEKVQAMSTKTKTLLTEYRCKTSTGKDRAIYECLAKSNGDIVTCTQPPHAQ